MRVLIACEYSGVVRSAFAALGHTAVSCDLLPTDNPRGWHVRGDVLGLLGAGWDLMIAHPPCTHLAVSGARHFAAKRESGVQQEALEFVRALMAAPIPRICIENPVCVMSTLYRRPDQIINPWQFGHGERKRTCLWLKGLPLLRATCMVTGREERISNMGKKDRGARRSVTYRGIAEAMAAQWSEPVYHLQTTMFDMEAT